MWINNQLSNFAFVLRSSVKNFLWVGNITNNPFDRCFSSTATFSEEGPFRARLTFSSNSRLLNSMYENAKNEPFPSVAGHLLRSVFKEKEFFAIGAILKSDSPVTMLHDVIVEIVPTITQTFALAGSDIDVAAFGTRVIIRTICLLTVPTLLKTWKALDAVEKEKFKNNLLVKKQVEANEDDPSAPVYMLTKYTSVKTSDGSQVTIPVYVFADGGFYDPQFAQIIKNNQTILSPGTLPEQGIVGLPVYYIADRSEITINRVPQPDPFMNRPEVAHQLNWLKENEIGAFVADSNFQKLIKYDKKSEKTVESAGLGKNEDAGGVAFASKLTSITNSGGQNLAEESSFIDVIETVLIDN
jgi:hypothetical protein